jgi:hypothetical protein
MCVSHEMWRPVLLPLFNGLHVRRWCMLTRHVADGPINAAVHIMPWSCPFLFNSYPFPCGLQLIVAFFADPLPFNLSTPHDREDPDSWNINAMSGIISPPNFSRPCSSTGGQSSLEWDMYIIGVIWDRAFALLTEDSYIVRIFIFQIVFRDSHVSANSHSQHQ